MMKVPRLPTCPECNHPLKEHQRDYSEEPFPPYWCDWCMDWCYMSEASPEPCPECGHLISSHFFDPKDPEEFSPWWCDGCYVAKNAVDATGWCYMGKSE